jgi:redox-sensitive bicupin YhaK (pirin superfamily)
MGQTRKIKLVLKSKPTLEGAGVSLRRAFGFGKTRIFDPFLLLDDFRGESPEYYEAGFPWHPHRGIETITYVLAGKVEHSDSIGNKGVIGPGDVQWMTAGNGIMHQEMPEGDPDGKMYGFQLWANLPKKMKMTPPRYQDVTDAQIPKLDMGKGVVVRVICGDYADAHGPAENVAINPLYLDVSVPAGVEYTIPARPDHTAFAYVFEGAGYFCQEKNPFTYEMEGNNYFDTERDALLGNHMLVVFDEGDQVQVTGGEQGVRFLFIAGKPLKEPVAWYGPIVMNTNEELQTAFRELQEGTFIKS